MWTLRRSLSERTDDGSQGRALMYVGSVDLGDGDVDVDAYDAAVYADVCCIPYKY